MPVLTMIVCSESLFLSQYLQDYSPFYFLSHSVNQISLMLRSWIHLHLSFVQGGKYRSICSLQYEDIQLDQDRLYKTCLFSPCVFLASLLKKDRCPQFYRLLSVLQTIQFYVYYNSSQCNLRLDMAISLVVLLLFGIVLHLLFCFIFSHKIESCLVKLCEKLCWNCSNWDCSESIDCF